MSKWITGRITELLGFEDDILIGTVVNYLTDQVSPDPKQMQLDVTGFLEKQAGSFVEELWTLLLDAQQNPHGIPSAFVASKKAELQASARPSRFSNAVNVPLQASAVNPVPAASAAAAVLVAAGATVAATNSAVALEKATAAAAALGPAARPDGAGPGKMEPPSQGTRAVADGSVNRRSRSRERHDDDGREQRRSRSGERRRSRDRGERHRKRSRSRSRRSPSRDRSRERRGDERRHHRRHHKDERGHHRDGSRGHRSDRELHDSRDRRDRRREGSRDRSHRKRSNSRDRDTVKGDSQEKEGPVGERSGSSTAESRTEVTD